jgi:hypothetical protein
MPHTERNSWDWSKGHSRKVYSGFQRTLVVLLTGQHQETYIVILPLYHSARNYFHIRALSCSLHIIPFVSSAAQTANSVSTFHATGNTSFSRHSDICTQHLFIVEESVFGRKKSSLHVGRNRCNWWRRCIVGDNVFCCNSFYNTVLARRRFLPPYTKVLSARNSFSYFG